MSAERVLGRRNFLNLAAILGAQLAAACGSSDSATWVGGRPGKPGAGGGAGASGAAGAGGAAGSGGAAGAAGSPGAAGASGAAGSGGVDPNSLKPFRAGISSFSDSASRRSAVARAIELSGGMSWLKPGDRVAIKVAHNSMNPYPATASPESCAEIVQLCLDAGASKVTVVDLMGIENTLVPGGWALEDMFGATPFSYDNDATVRAFRQSGLYDGIAAKVGAGNIGSNQKVYITSFREHGWRRLETASLTPGGAVNARLKSTWVQEQLANGVNLQGIHEPRVFTPRAFDMLLFGDTPGAYFPKLFDEVDHIVNLHRVATHVMSHFSTAMKNWVGTLRPDDRIWMHQLSYLLNQRGAGNDPIRTEPPYHELLPELHLGTHQRERLVFADASEIIVSGGPDQSPDPFFPAGLMLASTDLVTGDVVNLATLRLGVLASVLEQGLGGNCQPQPDSMLGAGFDYLLWRTQVDDNGLMRGTDTKLCDPSFSNWDWVVIQRARELGFGPKLPDEVGLLFANDGPHAVPPNQQKWLKEDALRWPKT